MGVFKEIEKADGSGVTTFYRLSDVHDTVETDDSEGTATIIDYNAAQNKPSVNGVALVGNKTSEDLGLQPAGDYITNDEADTKFIDEDELEAKNYVNQAELQDAIAHIEHFHREIVEALPVTGMDNVLYMVRKSGTGEDIYNEYIWVGLSSSENGYEFLGTTATDLTDYYKKSQVDAALATKVDKEGGKGLSEQNYTLAEKTKLAGLENYDDTEIQAEVSGLNTDVNNLKSSNVTISNTLAELKPNVESNTAAVSTIYDLLDNKMTAIRLVEQGDGWVWMNLEGSRLTYAQASAALGHENCMLFIEQLENDGKVIPAEYKSEGDHINVIFKDLDSLVHVMTCGEDDAIVTQDVTTTNRQADFTIEDEAVGYTTKMTALYGDTLQEGTPTPDTPVEIQNVNGRQSIKITGTNIFKMGDFETTDYGIDIKCENNLLTLNGTQDSTPDGERYVSLLSNTRGNYQNYVGGDYITLPAGTYTAKFIHISGTMENYTPTLAFCSGNHNPKPYLLRIQPGNTGSFTLTEDTIVRACINFKNNINNYKCRITLTNNGSSTDEFYVEKKYEVNLGNIELNKIGDYQDSIVKDNGKWYLNKQIGKVVLDGSESYSSNQSTETDIRFTQTALTNKRPSINNTGYSNYFLVRAESYKNGISLYTGDNNLYIWISKSIANDISSFKTWVSTHNIEVYYPLSTPTYTEITDTTLLAQLNALEQISQYKHTYITITGANLTPEADFTYIDNVVINNTDLVLGKDTYWNDEVPTQQDLPSNAQEGEIRIVQDTEDVYIYNGTKWVPFDKKVDLSNYLAKDNTTPWIPTEPFNPSTKKYVDDSISGIYIPTKTSQLTNDSNFITKNVNDLTNYYLKTNTYTKAEVDALIEGGGGGTGLNGTQLNADCAIDDLINNDTETFYYVGDNEIKLAVPTASSASHTITMTKDSFILIDRNGGYITVVTGGGGVYVYWKDTDSQNFYNGGCTLTEEDAYFKRDTYSKQEVNAIIGSPKIWNWASTTNIGARADKRGASTIYTNYKTYSLFPTITLDASKYSDEYSGFYYFSKNTVENGAGEIIFSSSDEIENTELYFTISNNLVSTVGLRPGNRVGILYHTWTTENGIATSGDDLEFGKEIYKLYKKNKYPLLMIHTNDTPQYIRNIYHTAFDGLYSLVQINSGSTSGYGDLVFQQPMEAHVNIGSTSNNDEIAVSYEYIVVRFADDEVTEVYVQSYSDNANFLSLSNVKEFTPTTDYQPATKKYVEDTVGAVFVPTKTSQLQNDSDFKNTSQVNSLIASALEGITEIKFEVVQTLPQTGENGVIYLIPNGGTTPNIYDEYVYINGNFEKIGNTAIDCGIKTLKADETEYYTSFYLEDMEDGTYVVKNISKDFPISFLCYPKLIKDKTDKTYNTYNRIILHNNDILQLFKVGDNINDDTRIRYIPTSDSKITCFSIKEIDDESDETSYSWNIDYIGLIKNNYSTSRHDTYNCHYLSGKLVNVGAEEDDNFKVNVLHSSNLWHYNTTKTTNGVTSTYENSTITLNGTAIGSGYNVSTNSAMLHLNAGNYALKLTEISGTKPSGQSLIIRNVTSGTNLVDTDFSTTNTYTFALSSDADIAVMVYFWNNNVFDNYKFGVQLQEGSKTNAYKPYILSSMYVDNEKFTETVGVGTSVNSANRVNVLHSKNLFNGNLFSNRSEHGVTTTFNNSEITFNGTTSSAGDLYTTTYGFYLEAGTYTFKFSRKSGTYTANDGASAIIIKKTDAWILNYEIGSIVSKPYSFTFTLDSKTQIGIEIFANASNQTFSNLILEVQLEKGSTATTYEPYVTPSIVVDNEEIYTKGQNEVYSTAEQRIGTWIDGKPLYRKVIIYTQAITKNTSFLIDTISNIDTMLPPEIDIRSSSQTNWFGDANYNFTFNTTLTTGEIYLNNNEDWSSPKLIVILKYTKTTD